MLTLEVEQAAAEAQEDMLTLLGRAQRLADALGVVYAVLVSPWTGNSLVVRQELLTPYEAARVVAVARPRARRPWYAAGR